MVARGRWSFAGPFRLASILQLVALALVIVYSRRPGEALAWDAEWIPWLAAIGCGSATLASTLVLTSRVGGFAADGGSDGDR